MGSLGTCRLPCRPPRLTALPFTRSGRPKCHCAPRAESGSNAPPVTGKVELQRNAGGLQASCSSSPGDKESLWLQLQLFSRQIQTAVANEDYYAAAQLKQSKEHLLTKLPSMAQLAYHQVAILQSPDSSFEDQINSLAVLSRLREKLALPAVLQCLRVPALSQWAEVAIRPLWEVHADGKVNLLMAEGSEAMRRHPSEYPRAKDCFSQIIELDPGFAEGWNKRATVNYMMHLYAESIEDCRRTLALDPDHYAAASGMGLCHLALKDKAQAAMAFERAVSIHPGLTHIQKYLLQLRQGGM